MAEEKQKKLDRLLSLLDADNALSKKDFVDSFEKVVDLVVSIQKQQGEAIERLEQTYANLLSKMDSDHSERFKTLKGQVDNLFVGDQLKRMDGETKASFEKRQREINEIINRKLREVDDRVSKLKDGPQGIQGLPGPIGPMPTEHLELMKEVQIELKKVKDILSNIPRGKNMGRAKVPIVRRVDLTSQVDGSTRSFNLPPDTVAVLGIHGSQFPFTMADVDFTLRGSVLTLGDQVATPANGQTMVALLEVLFYP